MPTTYTFTTAGTTTWTAPGDGTVDTECWGGGSGGARNGTTGGPGGGGGAYSKKSAYPVTNGTGYTVTVGDRSLGTTFTTSPAGGDSLFVNSSTCMAKGGSGVVTANVGAIGGLASAGAGDVKFSGGSGGNGALNFNGGGGGSSAGTAADGTNGQVPTAGAGGAGGTAPTGGGNGGAGGASSNGVVGTQPGGGGGAAGRGFSGAGGGVGKVVITFTPSGGGTTTQSLTGALALAGAVTKKTSAGKAGTVTPAGSLARLAGKPLAGALGLAGAVVRLVRRTFAAGLGFWEFGNFLRSTRKTLTGPLTLAGQMTPGTGPVRLAFTGALTLAGGLTRATGRVLGGLLGLTGVRRSLVARVLQGLLDLAGSLTRTRRQVKLIRDALAFAATQTDVAVYTLPRADQGEYGPLRRDMGVAFDGPAPDRGAYDPALTDTVDF